MLDDIFAKYISIVIIILIFINFDICHIKQFIKKTWEIKLNPC